MLWLEWDGEVVSRVNLEVSAHERREVFGR
jgi:hypothetical protein